MKEIFFVPKNNKTDQWYYSDKEFDSLYPSAIQALSKKHWTPLSVARQAAKFLSVKKGARILDIGSGAGKFCLAASYYYPDSFFTGIEQRRSLIEHAQRAAEILEADNVSFIHGNFTQLDFRNYDHFYFYNSFYENLVNVDRIDENLDYSAELYNYYSRYLFHLLAKKPAGTRIVTYHSLEEEIPPGYQLLYSDYDSILKFWVMV